MLSYILVVLLVIAAVGFFLFRTNRYGGFTGGMFGARVKRQVGQVALGSQSLVSSVMKVHILDGESPGKAIGLELTAGSVTGPEISSVAISIPEAKELISLL